MLTWEDDVEVHALHKQGWSISAIARHVGRDRKPVRAYLNGERAPGSANAPMIGLLAQTDGIAADVLAGMGITRAAILARTRDVVGAGSPRRWEALG
jgi:predicted transcriptional regulator